MSQRGWTRGPRANNFHHGNRGRGSFSSRVTTYFENPADFRSWSQSESPSLRNPHGYQENYHSNYNQSGVSPGLLPTPDRVFPRHDSQNAMGGRQQDATPPYDQRSNRFSNYPQAGSAHRDIGLAGRPLKRYPDTDVVSSIPKTPRLHMTYSNDDDHNNGYSHKRRGRGTSRGRGQNHPPRGRRAVRGSFPKRGINKGENGTSTYTCGNEISTSIASVDESNVDNQPEVSTENVTAKVEAGTSLSESNGEPARVDERQLEENPDAMAVSGTGPIVEGPANDIRCHICVMGFGNVQSLMKHTQTDIHQRMTKSKETEYLLKTELLRHQSLIAEQRLEAHRTNGRPKFLKQQYCPMCDVHFFGNGIYHRKSAHHQALKAYVHPSCTTCSKTFSSRMDRDHHWLAEEHLTKQAEMGFGVDSTQDSDDEVKDHVTVQIETRVSESAGNGTADYNSDEVMGVEFVEKVSVYFCRLCRKYYVNEVDALDLHCRTKEHQIRSNLKTKASKGSHPEHTAEEPIGDAPGAESTENEAVVDSRCPPTEGTASETRNEESKMKDDLTPLSDDLHVSAVTSNEN